MTHAQSNSSDVRSDFGFTDHQAKLLGHLLTLEGSPEDEMSRTLAGARVDMNPHQVEAALFALRSPLSRGAILADEVGLGKTIEASLIIAQRWAERRRQIILVVPATLRKQWAQELHEKFGLPSVVMETKRYKADKKANGANPFDRGGNDPQIVICSYQFASSKAADVGAVAWDLVIFDEAHKLRNVWQTTGAVIAKSLKKAFEGRQKLLLSATPLQNSLIELYGLSSIVDDHFFGPASAFRANYMVGKTGARNLPSLRERLTSICHRTLRRQVQEEGGISFTNRISITEDFTPSKDEQKLYEFVSDYLQRADSRAFSPNGRHLVTLILRKLLASSSFAIAGTLGKVIKRVEASKTSGVEAMEDFETAETLADEFDVDPEADEQDALALEAELQELRSYRDLAANISENAKGEALIRVLARALDKIEELGGQRKAVIFTESVRTQKYLRDLLSANGHAGRIVLMNGVNDDAESKARYKAWMERHAGTQVISGSKTADTKAAIVEAFRDDADILIATEAGGEGVNLQFCSLLINYDLPWNPQRVEQRIGRVHRYGQKCDVVVVNFINRSNAAEARVFELLDQKFQLFSGVFGASDEILGALESGVDIEKRINDIYQQCRSANEIEAAFDILQSELDDMIQSRDDDARSKLIENFDEAVAAKLKGRRETTDMQLGAHHRRLLALVKAMHPEARIEGHRFELDDATWTLDWREAEDDPVWFFRLGDPKADGMIAAAKERDVGPARITFDLDAYGAQIADAERFRGESGQLVAGVLRMNSLRERQRLVIAMQTDDGTPVPMETAERLLTVPAMATPAGIDVGMLEARLDGLIGEITERTVEEDRAFFSEEEAKLENWVEEAKTAARLALDEMTRDIKQLKIEKRRATSLEEKASVARQIKALEKKRRERQMALYDEEERIEAEQDELLDGVEAMLAMQTEWTPLVLAEWEIGV